MSRLAVNELDAASSGSQELVNIDICLLEDCPQCSFGHISRVIWNCGVSVCCGVKPDFVTTCSLPVELEPEISQLSYNLPMTEPGKTSHLRRNYNRVVAALARG